MSVGKNFNWVLQESVQEGRARVQVAERLSWEARTKVIAYQANPPSCPSNLLTRTRRHRFGSGSDESDLCPYLSYPYPHTCTGAQTHAHHYSTGISLLWQTLSDIFSERKTMFS